MKRRGRVEVCRLGRYESFGEESLLLNEAMSYSVVAAQNVKLAVINRQSLQGMFVDHPRCVRRGI